MARDRHRQGVCAAGLGHRADRMRGTDVTRDVGITRRRASRNLPQRLPDALLEGRAPDIERQIQPQ